MWNKIENRTHTSITHKTHALRRRPLIAHTLHTHPGQTIDWPNKITRPASIDQAHKKLTIRRSMTYNLPKRCTNAHTNTHQTTCQQNQQKSPQKHSRQRSRSTRQNHHRQRHAPLRPLRTPQSLRSYSNRSMHPFRSHHRFRPYSREPHAAQCAPSGNDRSRNHSPNDSITIRM